MVFQGDKKEGKSLLAGPEERIKQWLLPKVPRSVETYHLTVSTLAWSLLIIGFSFLARHNFNWLWGVSLMIVMQYLTDLLDGAIGRERNTGLVKWGYYMDHFLDYIFLCAILIGYGILLPDHFKYMLFYVLALFGAFMANSFLAFAATNKFRISYYGMGPTEMRIGFILINTLLIVFGTDGLARAIPPVLGIATFALFVTVYRTQKELWQIDMAARHGNADAIDTAQEATPTLSLAGIGWGGFLTNVGASYVIGTLAFVLLVTRVGYPWHRLIAGTMFVVGLAPAILSAHRRRKLLRAQADVVKQRVRPYYPHIGVGVLLIVFAYCAHILAPAEDSLLTKLSEGELREDLERDLASLHLIRLSGMELISQIDSGGVFDHQLSDLTPPERDDLINFWQECVNNSLELDILQRRYRGFFLLDYNTTADLHASAYLAAFGAFTTQYRLMATLWDALEPRPYTEAFLDEGHPSFGIPPGTASAIQRRLLHPDTLLRLNAGAAYMKLIEDDLKRNTPDGLKTLRSDVRAIYLHAGRNPNIVIGAPLAALEQAAHDAWLPFQKRIAVQMSLIRTQNRAYFITPDQIQPYADRFRPGDILIERRNWHMTNIGIPGFWPHAALYVGTPDEINSSFGELALPDDQTPAQQLAAEAPNIFKFVGSPDAQGFARRVIEAQRDGVIFTSLEDSVNCDYLAVIRPNISDSERFTALKKALSHYGKPYDYDFDFSTENALVCSELVSRAYEGCASLPLDPKEMNGRLILPPNEIIRRFDISADTAEPAFDFVLFLDGSEAEQTFIEKDAGALRASWRRPKWDIMAE